MLAEHQGILCRCHQAGIKADEIEFHTAVRQGLVDLCQTHGAAGTELLVIAVAADTAAAVIPEDQGIPVGGELVGTPTDEGGEGVGIRHGYAAQILFQTHHPLTGHLPDLIGLAAENVVLPLLAAAGVDDQVYILDDFRIQHFLQVPGSHLAAGFQVGAAEVEHQGHFVPAAA